MKASSRFFSLLFLAGTLLLAACVPVEPPTPAPGNPNTGDAPFVGLHWNLVGYGTQPNLTVPVAPATLNPDAQNLGGTTGCNHYGIGYTLQGNTFTFTGPGMMMTEMACPEPQMQQEADFVRIMGKVTTYQINNGQLILEGSEGVLVFEEAANTALEGTTWQLNGLAQNDAVVSMLVDEQITLTLKDGQLTGFGGCNNYFGSYTLADDQLTFGVIGATKMFCEGDAGEREAELFAALAKVVSYKIERNSLTFLDRNDQMVIGWVSVEK